MKRNPLIALMALILLFCACTSQRYDFRRFEVGKVPPELLFETAKNVVSDFYANIYGGLKIIEDKSKLIFETDYVKNRTAMDRLEGQGGKALETLIPSRQKFYCRVLPTQSGVDLEVFATYETISIDDPDDIKSPSDIWKIKRQDTQLEDTIVDNILKDLMAQGAIK